MAILNREEEDVPIGVGVGRRLLGLVESDDVVMLWVAASGSEGLGPGVSSELR